MKRSLFAIALVLALVLGFNNNAKAEGGFGFSMGLRLKGDFNYWGWSSCNPGSNTQVWPMGDASGYPQMGYGYPQAGYGYPYYGAVSPSIYGGGYGGLSPSYSTYPQGVVPSPVPSTGTATTPPSGGTIQTPQSPPSQPLPSGTGSQQ